MNAPFVARSLTLVPRSLLLNRTETLAKQAKHVSPIDFVSGLGFWIPIVKAGILDSLYFFPGRLITPRFLEFVCFFFTPCLDCKDLKPQ